MRFDIFHEIGKKYLAADALTQFKTKFLYTLCLVFREMFVLIRQNLHGTVVLEYNHRHEMLNKL